MDPELGDLPPGDILIEDGKIAGVEQQHRCRRGGGRRSGRIAIPGSSTLTGTPGRPRSAACAPNATLDDYFVEVLDTFAPPYRADDVYASNLAGSLECLNAGITTLVDWSHINNTPEHADAAIHGLQETGIRAQYAYGSANTSLAKYWFERKIDPG